MDTNKDMLITTPLSDIISNIIAIFALRSAFNHLNKLDNDYRLEETEALPLVTE